MSPSTSYQPDEAAQAKISDTTTKRDRWRQDRQPHEQEWFINAAMLRGNHYVEWNATHARVETKKTPAHRVRLKINRLQAKIRARTAKFLKNRPRPIVTPATQEFADYLNAKASQKVLDYIWRKQRLEEKLRDVLQWASVGGKGFWWLHWDFDVMGRMVDRDPTTGVASYRDEILGDVAVEVGSPFEVLVADPGIMRIGDQPEIMRVKMRKLATMQARYPDFADYLVADSSEESLFTFERQIAGLNPYSYTTGGKREQGDDEVLVTEHFIGPSAEAPGGEYRVLVGAVLVKAEELPYEFQDFANPFPVVEFPDIPVPGQFWPATICSQLVDLQREYNLLRSKLAENLRLMAHPKIFVAKQHQIPKSSWTSEAGEIIEFVAIPQLEGPKPWTPPNVAGDLWNAISLIQKEFDDITQIFPAAEGKTAGATSGFQTNLLQEATDTVHQPDVRQMELGVEEAMLKVRKLIKLGYTKPRLIAAVGLNYQPEIFEFVNDQIDEMADVIVEAGSGLPTLKAAKQDAVMNIYKSGLMGDPADPEVRRRTLSILEMGALEEAFDIARTDENQARLETKEMGEGRQVEPPHFWENHKVHYDYHTLMLKSAESRMWDAPRRRALMVHAVLHASYINPQSALQLAIEEGLQEVIPVIQAKLPPPMVGMPGPGGPPPGAGAPGPPVAGGRAQAPPPQPPQG